MNQAPTAYDDTYTGPRWTYGLNLRPLATAQVPAGWIVFSNRINPEFNFGTVQYPRQLTDNEVTQYGLTAI